MLVCVCVCTSVRVCARVTCMYMYCVSLHDCAFVSTIFFVCGGDFYVWVRI